MLSVYIATPWTSKEIGINFEFNYGYCELFDFCSLLFFETVILISKVLSSFTALCLN